MPVWHVSVARQTASGPRRFETLKRKHVREGVEIAKELLRGVGKAPTVFTTEPPGDCIHVQKPLTEEEIALLPAGWMEIPAVDERGPCRVLERV